MKNTSGDWSQCKSLKHPTIDKFGETQYTYMTNPIVLFILIYILGLFRYATHPCEMLQKLLMLIHMNAQFLFSALDKFKVHKVAGIKKRFSCCLGREASYLISVATSIYFFVFYLGDSDEKSKRGPKRKKPPPSAIENDFLPKRRSARV